MALTKVDPTVVNDQVFGRRNLIINGDMRIAQRGTSSTAFAHLLDRFYNDYNGGTVTYAQSALSSSDTPYTHGFRSAVKITNTSAGSDAAANYVRFQQKIEATNLANSGWNYTSATSFVTLSFWVKSSLAGTYAIQIYNVDAGAKSYSFEFTLSANTWTKVTHAIKGDSGVVINDDSGEGLAVQFFVHAGTNYSTSGHTNEAWQTYSGSDQVKDYGQSWSATASATFEITGLQLEVGSQATPFEHRSFGEELALCQRYCQKYGPYGANSFPFGPSGYSYAATTTAVGQILPAELRASPSISFNGDGNPELRGGNTAGSNTLSAVTSVSSIISAGTSLMMNVTTSGNSNETGQVRVLCNASANNFMIYDAEL